MEHKSGKTREQIELISLEEMVGKDSPARQIDQIVEEMDRRILSVQR